MLIEGPLVPVKLVPEKTVTDADVYLRAVEVIEERGWTDGGWVREDGVCILGAIGIAALELNHPAVAYAQRISEENRVIYAADQMVGGADETQKLYEWNDRLIYEKSNFWTKKPAEQVKQRLREMARS